MVWITTPLDWIFKSAAVNARHFTMCSDSSLLLGYEISADRVGVKEKFWPRIILSK